MLGYVDHGGTDHHGGGGEPVAELLRPGRAGSNTAVDHVTVLDTALAQIPEPLRRPDEHGRVAVLVRTDAAGASKEFAAHLHHTGVEFSVGASFAHLDITTALALLPQAGWTPAYQARKPRAAEIGVQIEPRGGAWVAEATGLVDLSGWPPGTRLILRKERPHPGAQLRITDADGLRVTGFLTNTGPGGPGRQLADLELRHRRHARVEDRIRFFKQQLGWTTPRLRDPVAADRWTWLIIAVYTQLRLARRLTDDLRRPWERPCPPDRLTPTRARRGFRYLRPKIGLPAGAPKPTRPGPGRPPGTPNRVRATRHHVGKTTKRATSITAHRQETG